MNVFITWSGERSHSIAKTLRDWLPDVIQRVEPFLSSEDISKGANWGHEITKQLRTCPVGVICLTPENLTAPWILFESGAISNNVEILTTQVGPEVGQPKACTYLYDLATTDVQKPLEMFQATVAKDKDDNRKLLTTINEALGKEKLEVAKLDRAFETYWPKLSEKLQAIPKPKSVSTAPPKRDTEDILLEVLTEVRNLSRGMVVNAHNPYVKEVNWPKFQLWLRERGFANTGNEEDLLKAFLTMNGFLVSETPPSESSEGLPRKYRLLRGEP